MPSFYLKKPSLPLPPASYSMGIGVLSPEEKGKIMEA
jgi:hypothetical protein